MNGIIIALLILVYPTIFALGLVLGCFYGFKKFYKPEKEEVVVVEKPEPEKGKEDPNTKLIQEYFNTMLNFGGEE